jgi:hypothetical protein
MNSLAISGPLSRGRYALAVAALVALKVAVDIAVFRALTGQLISPDAALDPWLSGRAPGLALGARLLLVGVIDLPFLWIGLTLSCRRAADAGLHPLVGILFLVPLLNCLVGMLLSVLPPQTAGAAAPARDGVGMQHLLTSAAAGAAVAIAMMLVAALLLRDYGAALFVGAPFALGVVTGFRFNRGQPRSRLATVWATQLALGLVGGALIAFALEGVVCLIMAYPLAAPVAALGGALGAHLAAAPTAGAAHLACMLLAWPLLCGAELPARHTPLRAVTTTVEIDAPPEVVWPQVTGFAELPPPSEWAFRLGIAYPQRARIAGTGVGAVRYCEFSTGPFVEPVTAWEPPSRLAFDVASTPPPMHEWSPYQTVHAPHLISTLRSRHGEFRLVALPGGRTRLEGTTWYELALFPQAYWTVWSDALIHAIHRRVLEHIARRAEADHAGAL